MKNSSWLLHLRKLISSGHQFRFILVVVAFLQGPLVMATPDYTEIQTSKSIFHDAARAYAKKFDLKNTLRSPMIATSIANAHVFIEELNPQQRQDLIYAEHLSLGFALDSAYKIGDEELLMAFADSIDFTSQIEVTTSESFGESIIKAFSRKPFLKPLLDNGYIQLDMLPLEFIKYLSLQVWEEKNPDFIFNFEDILRSHGFGPSFNEVATEASPILTNQVLAKKCLQDPRQQTSKTLNPSVYPLINNFRSQILSNRSNTKGLQSNYYNLVYENEDCELIIDLKFEVALGELKVHSLAGEVKSRKLGQKANLSFEDIVNLAGLRGILLP